MQLGKLEKITDLRSVWADEARNFTPWLAQEENLVELGEAIGVDLELDEQEKNIGPFRADIVCKDTLNDSWVLIENQLERTDHNHLGQLLTYAAGLHAVTIIWIARRFTEEHRAALDWLNEITAEDVNFFGLEIELWRIGSSSVAPKFNMISKPNGWTKSVVAARNTPSGGISETKQLQFEYWQALAQQLESSGSFLKVQSPRPQHWMDFSVGRSGFAMATLANTRDNRIEVQLIIQQGDIDAFYNLLLEQKEEIEHELSAELAWQPLSHRKRSQMTLTLPNTDPTNRSDWPRQHAWLQKNLEAFHRAFSPRIKRLNSADWVPDELDDIDLDTD